MTLRFGGSTKCLLIVLLVSVVGCSSDGTRRPPPLDAPYQVDPTRSLFYQRTVGMRRAPPLHERGFKRLVVLYRSASVVYLDYLGLTAFSNQHYEARAEEFVPSNYGKNLVLELINASPHVSAAVVGDGQDEALDQIEAASGASEDSIAKFGLDWLADLRRSGVDALLVIRETSMPSPRGGDLWARMAPLGLYRAPRYPVRAYAGFEFLLLDATNGRQVKNSKFIQVSMAPVPAVRQISDPKFYTPVEKAAISEALKARIKNNVILALQLLKIIPAEDGEYLTYDPEVENPPGLYPE